MRDEENERLLFPLTDKPNSGEVEAERSGKGVWYPEEHDRNIWSCFRAGIARQAVFPGETPMSSLRTGKRSNRGRLN